MAGKVENFRPSSSSPSAPRKLGDDGAVQTADQLRVAIDSGRGGDKVDAVDPAAAPLGTDDEAAGTPPTRLAVATAAHHEINSRPSETKKRASGVAAVWWLIGVFVVMGAGIAAIPFFIAGR